MGFIKMKRHMASSLADCLVGIVKSFPKQLLHKILQLYNINAHIPYARPFFRW